MSAPTCWQGIAYAIVFGVILIGFYVDENWLAFGITIGLAISLPIVIILIFGVGDKKR